jgi:hypothetical protein
MLAASLVAAGALTACGGGGGYAPAFSPAPPAPDLAVSVGGSLDMLPNQENTILVTVQSLGTIAATGAVLTVPTPVGFTYEVAWCTSATGGATCPANTTAQALTAHSAKRSATRCAQVHSRRRDVADGGNLCGIHRHGKCRR